MPFLDKDFLQLVMNIDAREKMCRATVGGRTGLQMSIVRLSHVHRGRRIVKVLVCVAEIQLRLIGVFIKSVNYFHQDATRAGESGKTTRAEGNVEKWILRKAFDVGTGKVRMSLRRHA